MFVYDKLTDLEIYKVFTAVELAHRGYDADAIKDMIKKSILTKRMNSKSAWAYCHDMGPEEWADWIEEENGFKERPIPLWKQKYCVI